MNKETIIRTVVAAIVAVNEALMACGVTAFDDVTEQNAYMVVSTVVMIGAWAWSHYKNNDFTAEASEGTGLTRLLKAQRNREINGENFADEAEEIEEVENDA